MSVAGETLDRHVTIQHGDDHVPILGFQAPVHDQQVPVEDAGPGHRVPRYPDQKRRVGMIDQPVVQTQVPCRVILRDRRKTGVHGLHHERQPARMGVAPITPHPFDLRLL